MERVNKNIAKKSGCARNRETNGDPFIWAACTVPARSIFLVAYGRLFGVPGDTHAA
jgi:hypothetical protein